MVKTLSHQLGWKQAWCSFFFHLIWFPAWAILKLKMKRSLKTIAPKGGSKLVHKVFSYIIFLEYKLLPRSVVGTSILFCFHLK
ncbi:MAG TPA: hypothetical protein DIT99_22555 [Candidatus Latescibacteria bacterium]|nr:hypothetical protein [Candidatus Latescibacterota bacterium]